MLSYKKRGQVYSYMESPLWKREVCLILGEYEHCYLLNTSAKGVLKILHVTRKQNKSMFVPTEWPDIVTYDDGVTQ